MKRWLPWTLLAAVAAFVAWKLRSSHFDWAGFGRSLRTADWRLLLAAILVIYSANLFRALRWSVFLRPAYKATATLPTPWWRLVSPQFVGFTGLAIFGRIGELIRPLLVARRTGLTFSSQIAVVTVERIFDLGAFAFIFSLNLLLSPGLQTLPHHEYFRKVGLAIAALTLVLGLFVVAVRLAGPSVARIISRLFSLISARRARRLPKNSLPSAMASTSFKVLVPSSQSSHAALPSGPRSQSPMSSPCAPFLCRFMT